MDLSFIKTQQLDDLQLKQLEQLRSDCKVVDHNSIPYYAYLLSQFRPFIPTVLCYQNDTLVGFLAVFFFYEDACEISMMVSPAFRRQGIAQLMTSEVFDEMYIEKVIVSTPRSESKSWLSERGFTYHNSEYEMRRSCDIPIQYTKSANSIIRLVVLDDVARLSEIHIACFGEQSSGIADRLLTLCQDPSYQIWVMEQDGQSLAKVHLYFQNDDIRIMDFAVDPAVQKRGLGGELLSFCISYAQSLNKRNTVLEVKHINQSAIRLYKRFGFETSNSVDFWIIETQRLQSGML